MTGAHAADILRINAGSRPGVAALDAFELRRLLSLSHLQRVAMAADDEGQLAGYALAC